MSDWGGIVTVLSAVMSAPDYRESSSVQSYVAHVLMYTAHQKHDHKPNPASRRNTAAPKQILTITRPQDSGRRKG